MEHKETFLGRPVHHSKASISKSRRKLQSAMREVHESIPSTVPSHVTGERRESMLAAIAYSKARKRGAKLPRKD